MARRILTAALAVVTILSLSACTFDDGQAQRREDDSKSDQAYAQQAAAQPYPAEQLRDSLERANLRQRLLRENKPNQIRYIYLLGDTGTYIGYYTIKGKVSSNQSQMQPQDDELRHSGWGSVVDGPGDDGSYGEDSEGQFFFTTEGVMVSTDMRYIVSDAPLAVDVPKLNVKK